MAGMNIPLALGPGDVDDGDPGRQMRGMAIAALVRIDKERQGYRVPSQSGNGAYYVNTDPTKASCTCPDFAKRGRRCKHIVAVEIVIQREELDDGTTVETTSVRTTYRQQWPAYNLAQQREEEHFLRLLRELCDLIPEPARAATGRPPLPLSDIVFCAGVKVFGTKSTRRSMTAMRSAQKADLVSKAPSCASIYRCMEDPALAPVLVDLIRASALPLQAIEDRFAIDSTGFSTSVFMRWFDKKHNRMHQEAKWVKAHIACGVVTNIITDVAVTANESADAPFFRPFVETTAQNFTVREVSADKAYVSKNNLRAAQAVGATAYIPFKSNSNPTQGHHKRDTLWERAYHFYHLHRAEFEAHYHARSNVETSFWMVKSKFGGSVRSKNPEAQVNEALLKFLCHNICCLIQSVYELGVEPIFDQQALQTPPSFGADQSSPPKLAWE